MLPPFIIEQIRQREEEKLRDDRPMLELPLDDFGPRGGWDPAGRRRHDPSGHDPSRSERPSPEGGRGEPERERVPGFERGVTIIQF